MAEKKNIFNFSIKITVLAVIILFYSFNNCNSEIINKSENVKLLKNNVDNESIEPDKSNTLTQDILDENSKNLFEITYEEIGNMVETSGLHWTYLLPNGKVLITGRDTELYDPETNQFSLISKKATYRPLFTKKNIVYSGYVSPQAEYNFKKNVFKFYSVKKREKIKEKFEKFIHTIKFTSKKYFVVKHFKGDQVLLLGNRTPECNIKCSEVLLVDNKNFKIFEYGKLSVNRTEFDSVMLENGKILIIGGSVKNNDGNISGVSSLELYNPKTGEVKLVGNLNYPRIEARSILLKDGRVLITGGYIHRKQPILYNKALTGRFLRYFDNAEIFDPITEKIIAIPNTFGRHRIRSNDYELALLNDGKVLLYGKRARIFDPKSNKLYFIPIFKTERTKNQLTVLDNGQVLISGGYGYNGSLSSCLLFTINDK